MQDLIQKYVEFENIIPEEFKIIDFNQLKQLKNESDVISNQDLEFVKGMAKQNNVRLDVEKFKKIDYIIRMGFYRYNDTGQEQVPFYFAHWYMSMVSIDMLTTAVTDIVPSLLNYYELYTSEKSAVHFRNFIRAFQDFYGYIVNIKQTIYDYHDLFVRTCNKIDPTYNEKPYYAFKSDICADELYAAVMELLLHGNVGRLTGFSLLRSMIEISVLRQLLDLRDSERYENKEIEFRNDYPLSVSAVCSAIDRIAYGNLFETDTIIRLYNWQSKVSHVGFRSDEYVTWFVRDTCAQLCNLFSQNVKIYKDKIIENLERTDQIKIKNKTSE